MTRRWPLVMALVAGVALQVGLAPQLAIAHVVPNLVLLVVVTVALVRGPDAGCVVGFVGGLALDLLGSAPVGPWALVLCVIGYVAGMLHAQMFAEGWLLPVTVVAVAGLLAEVAYGLLLGILGVGGDLAATFVRLMLPGAVYNTALAVLVYPWLTRLLRPERPMTTFRRLA